MMKQLLKETLIILLIAIVFFSLMFFYKENNEPTVNITAEILNVNDQQYECIGTSGIVNPSKDDFKIFKPFKGFI